MSESLQKLCSHSVQLPMLGRADSLNVGVAAGMMMYEFMRRRMQPSCSSVITKQWGET